MTTPFEIEKLRYELINKCKEDDKTGPLGALHKATNMLWKLSGEVAGYQLSTLNTIDLLKIYNSRGFAPYFHHVKNQYGEWEFKTYYCSNGPCYFDTPDIYEDTILVDEYTTTHDTFRESVVGFHYQDKTKEPSYKSEPSYLINFLEAYKDTEYMVYHNDRSRYAIAFEDHMSKRDNEIDIAIPEKCFFKPGQDLFLKNAT